MAEPCGEWEQTCYGIFFTYYYQRRGGSVQEEILVKRGRIRKSDSRLLLASGPSSFPRREEALNRGQGDALAEKGHE